MLSSVLLCLTSGSAYEMLGNVPVSKDLFISFVNGIENSSQISFKILTGMLLNFDAEKDLIINDFLRVDRLNKD